MTANGNIQHTGSQRDVKDKEKNRRELLAKYLYDVSKLVIAALFLINIPPLVGGNFELSDIVTSCVGLFSSIATAWLANRLLIY